MAEECEVNIISESISKTIAKRNNYFSGKRIGSKDLTLDQKYFIDKIKQINREMIGYGIINGLNVSLSEINKIMIT